jgi:hypothetical protein
VPHGRRRNKKNVAIIYYISPIILAQSSGRNRFPSRKMKEK